MSARSYVGPTVLAGEVGLARWQLQRAASAGMLPEPGHALGWLPEQLDDVRRLVPIIVATFGSEHPIGATRPVRRCCTARADRAAPSVESSSSR